jgi:CTP:molybdopterin cytidylyltransferase MocA
MVENQKELKVIAGLVLAAGAGSRFGQPKAAVEFAGERLVDRAVTLLRDSGCEKVFVVLGAWVSEVPNAKVLINENWQVGMSSSLKVGLEELISNDEIDSVVITLVDLPGINVAAVKEIIHSPGDLVVATFNQKRGHPVKFAREHFAAIAQTLSGDSGAREYLRGRSDVVLVELSHLAEGSDLDLPGEIEKFS